MQLEVSDEAIHDVLNQCTEQDAKGGSRWPNMTYEQGVQEALRWAVGFSDTNPMTD